MNVGAGSARRSALLALAAALLAACGAGDDPADSKSATLRVSLTDAPACGFDRVFVTVEKVRVHPSATVDERAAGWTDVTVNPPKKIDLLALTNGQTELLGQAPIADGDYAQIRLVLRRSGISVVPSGGQETAVQAASEVERGIRIVRPFTVAKNARAELVLDVDACRSIVPNGAGSYQLKPVVAAHLIDAEIEGSVDPGAAGAIVSVQKNGEPIRSTVAAATGAFRVPFLDSAQSPYEVVVTAPDRSTAVITGVPVSKSAVTSVGSIPMPASGLAAPSRTVSGTVGPFAAQELAEVRASQAVGVPAVEVALRNVNAANGAYSLALPREAPRLAAYSTRLPLAFAAQTAIEGRYTVQARAAGFAPRAELADLRSANLTLNFTLEAVP